jgi:adenylate kinase
MRIVILGAPGSGKKTQTSLLADKYQLTVVTTSELVKQALAEESERGLQLRQQQQVGQPLTDDVVLSLLQERLDRDDLNNGFILDGFPRNLLQALTLDELLNELELPLDLILLFEIETDALMERLVGRRTCRSCGTVFNVYTQPTAVEDVCDLCGGRLHQRADDTEDTVSSRLHVFDHLTGPLLGHYGKQGKVLRVDGEGEVEAVFTRTQQAIDRYLERRFAEQAQVELSTIPAQPPSAAADLAATPAPAAAAAPFEMSPESAAKSSAQKSAVKRIPAGKSKALKKRVNSPKQQLAVKKASAKSSVVAKRGKRAAASSPLANNKAGAKRVVRKRVTTKKVVAKKTANKKKVVAKSSIAAKSTAKKSAVAKKAAVKRASTAKAKPVVTKKGAGKKKVVKKTATKKTVAKKGVSQGTLARPGAKKKTSKPATRKKTVKKQAAGKRTKGSAGRR